jgi:aspartate aminotransferase-like enzyme
MKRRYLLTPGPSQVPSFVREALGREMLHHRTEEFREILKASGEGLKEIFCTKNPVLVLASSGTGAMEAAVTNLVNKGEKIIVLRGGKFSERWAEIAKAWSIETINMDVAWGTSPDPVELDKILTANRGVKAVFTTLCETSTATVFDIKALAQITKKHNVMIVVDAISGLGQDLLLTDEWSVDVVVSGSQKGLMLPPGLAFISLNEIAQAAALTANQPTFYFSLKKALKNY